MAIDLERECFFIAPIGEDGSPTRERSDGVRDLIVKEAAEAHGLETRRADEFGEPGQLTSQIVHHCMEAKMCVADLTDGNPNVYYELSVRHGKQLPVVLIAEVGTELPFDVGQSHVIFFDHTSFTSGREAREKVKEQIGVALEKGVPADNPISTGMWLAELQKGGGEEKALALVMEQLERLSVTTSDVDSRLRKAEQREAVQRALRNRIDAASPPELNDYAYLQGFASAQKEEMQGGAEASPLPVYDDDVIDEES